jgi:hypothetical protein
VYGTKGKITARDKEEEDGYDYSTDGGWTSAKMAVEVSTVLWRRERAWGA